MGQCGKKVLGRFKKERIQFLSIREDELQLDQVYKMPHESRLIFLVFEIKNGKRQGKTVTKVLCGVCRSFSNGRAFIQAQDNLLHGTMLSNLSTNVILG